MNIEPLRFLSYSKVRNHFKKIQQLSWDINQFERRFPFENRDNLTYYLSAYLEFFEQLKKTYPELKKDLDYLIENETKTDGK